MPRISSLLAALAAHYKSSWFGTEQLSSAEYRAVHNITASGPALNPAAEAHDERASRYILDCNPFEQPIQPRYRGVENIHDANGHLLGKAFACLGVAEGTHQFDLPDGSRLSASCYYDKDSDDSVLIAYAQMPDESWVKLMIVADGVGGQKEGNLAASAFCKGAYAFFQIAIREGRVPTSEELMKAGVKAVNAQREFQFHRLVKEDPHPNDEQIRSKLSDTTLTVTVIHNDRFTTSTAGDSMQIKPVPIGLTDQFTVGSFTEVHTAKNLQHPTSVTGTATDGERCHYQGTLSPKEGLLTAVDSIWEFFLGERTFRLSCFVSMQDLFKEFPGYEEPGPKLFGSVRIFLSRFGINLRAKDVTDHIRHQSAEVTDGLCVAHYQSSRGAGTKSDVTLPEHFQDMEPAL